MRNWGIAEIATYRPSFSLSDAMAEGLGADPLVPLAAPDEDAFTLMWESLTRLDRGVSSNETLLLGLPASGLEPRALAAHAAASRAMARGVNVVSMSSDSDAPGMLRIAHLLKNESVGVLVDYSPHDLRLAPPAELSIAVRFGEPKVALVEAITDRNELSFDRWAQDNGSPHDVDQRFVEEVAVIEAGNSLLDELLKGTGRESGGLVGAVVTCAVPLKPVRLARTLGVPQAWQSAPSAAEPGVQSAAALLLALEQLARGGPGDAIALLDLGWGGSGAIIVAGPDIARVVSVSTSARKPYDYASWVTSVDRQRRPGPWTSAAKLHREAEGLLGLVGVRCSECGGASFPEQPTCEMCGKPSVQPAMLTPAGTVVTQTTDHLFGAPENVVQMVVVDLDGGGRFFGQTAFDSARPFVIGDHARLVIRRLHVSAGLGHYFWKATLDD